MFKNINRLNFVVWGSIAIWGMYVYKWIYLAIVAIL